MDNGYEIFIERDDNDNFSIGEHKILDDKDLQLLVRLNRDDKKQCEMHDKIILNLCKRIKQLKTNIDSYVASALVNF